MLAEVLNEQAVLLLAALLPEAERSLVKVIARTSEKHYIMDFPTPEAALAFTRLAREFAPTFELLPLRVQLDSTFEERQTGWILSKVYQPLFNHLQNRGETFKLAVDKRKGWVFASIGRKCIVCFSTSKIMAGTASTWSVEPHLEGLSSLGVSAEAAKAWVEGVEASVPGL
jgi:hypothetical protein